MQGTRATPFRPGVECAARCGTSVAHQRRVVAERPEADCKPRNVPNETFSNHWRLATRRLATRELRLRPPVQVRPALRRGAFCRLGWLPHLDYDATATFGTKRNGNWRIDNWCFGNWRGVEQQRPAANSGAAGAVDSDSGAATGAAGQRRTTAARDRDHQGRADEARPPSNSRLMGARAGHRSFGRWVRLPPPLPAGPPPLHVVAATAAAAARAELETLMARRRP